MKNTVTTRRVIAEANEQGWLVMWPDGRVDWFSTKRAVLAAIRRTATSDIDIATIEWRA